MSDRCNLQMTFRKPDAPAVQGVLGEWQEVVNEDDTSITVEYRQVDHGMTLDRTRLAAAGVPFYGHHEQGYEYGPMVFAAANGELVEADTNWESQNPVVELDEDYRLSGAGLDDARQLHIKRTEARRLIHR